MIGKLLLYIKHCFEPPVVEKPLTNRELAAMKNTITAAKERIWIADSHPRRPEPHMEYDLDIDDMSIDVLRQSIKIVEHTIITHQNMNEDE